MATADRQRQNTRVKAPDSVRNPYGVMDAPDPDGGEVRDFADGVTLDGSANDDNAPAWGSCGQGGTSATLEGDWCSRWNGGPDPTIPGDTRETWKQGQGEVRLAGDRVYILFDWDDQARQGLIEAKRHPDGRLIGQYINLTSPEIVVAWVGRVVSNRRIDGRHEGGRLDFRR